MGERWLPSNTERPGTASGVGRGESFSPRRGAGRQPPGTVHLPSCGVRALRPDTAPCSAGRLSFVLTDLGRTRPDEEPVSRHHSRPDTCCLLLLLSDALLLCFLRFWVAIWRSRCFAWLSPLEQVSS